MGYSESVISTYNYHAKNINNEKAIVDVVHFCKIVGSVEFKLEGKGSPEEHKANLTKI